MELTYTLYNLCLYYFLKIEKLPILILSFRLSITLFDWNDDLSATGIVWRQMASFGDRWYHLASVAPNLRQ